MSDLLSVAADAVALATQVFFGATFVTVGARALHERTRPSIDVTLFFGAMTLLVSGSRVAATAQVPTVAVALFIELLILLLPYLMLRLVADFAGLPRRVARIAEVALIAQYAALVFFRGVPPPPLAVIATAYVVVPLVWSAVAFAREARRARGITRRRYQAIVSGSAFIAVGVLALGLPAAVSALRDASVLRLVSELVGLGAGAAYFVGFAPPLWLRRLWQEPELRSFLADAPRLAGVTGTERLLREIADGARGALGAEGVLIGVPAGVGRLRFHGTGPSYEAATGDTFGGLAIAAGKAIASRDPARDVPGQAALYRERDVEMLIAAPIRTGDEVLGALTVRTSHPSLFTDDDLRTCQLLADQAAVLLKAHALVEAAAYNASHDALTGLPNAARLLEELARMPARSDDPPFALALIDLDGFADVNQTFGHTVADGILAQAAERFTSAAGPPAVVARWSGDRYAVLLPGATLDVAEAAATRLLASLEHPFTAEQEEIELGASIGVAAFPQHAQDVRELVASAEVALGVAKRTANTYAVCPPEARPPRTGRLALRADLRQAIANGSITVHYQPLASMRSGRIVRLEALARWDHPRRGVVAPADFIQLAERTGLIRPLTERILERAVIDIASWRRDHPDLRVAVNFSARAFADAGLVDMIRAATKGPGRDPRALSVEITESVLMTEPDLARRTVERLHDLGVSVEIDDFGTGYSSLAYLQRLPVDGVKIDRQFVLAVTKDERSDAIVRATIRLSHELGFEVTAEGIEDLRSWDLLAASGCDVGQGYLISEPMSAYAVAGWLASWRHERLTGPLPPNPEPLAVAVQRLVLVVDDDPTIVAIVGDVLREHGYAVATAANGEEALALVGLARPALVLLDVHMPVLDAGGFAAALHAKGISIPLVVMSAGPNAPRWAQRLDASGHLAKPFAIEQLLAVTRRALEGAAKGLN